MSGHMSGHTSAQRLRALAATTALLTACVLGAVVLSTTHIIGSVFPGFAIRVANPLPQVLPSWLEIRASGIAHRQVLEVDGASFDSTRKIYDYVASSSAGTPIHYRFLRADGSFAEQDIPSRRVDGFDYTGLFGIYLVTAFAFLAVGIATLWRNPREPVSLALYSLGWTAGAFYLTDIPTGVPPVIGPLHDLVSILIPASILHLALVFPVNRLGRRPTLTLAAVYLAWVALAFAEHVVLPALAWPRVVSNFTGLIHAGAIALFLTMATYGSFASTRPNVRRRARIATLGSLFVLSLPALFRTAAPLLQLPAIVAASGTPTFLLPLFLAYASTEKDSFEFVLAPPRIAALLAFSMTVIAVSGLAILVPRSQLWQDYATLQAPLAVASLVATALILFGFLRAQFLRILDHRADPVEYDGEAALTEFSDRLARAHGVASVIGEGEILIGKIFTPLETMTFLDRNSGRLWLQFAGPGNRRELCLPKGMKERLETGEILTRYEWESRGDLPMPRVWRDLGVDVLLPLRAASVFGVLAVGRMHSGRRYGEKDLRFLKAACNQLTLGLTKATMFDQMEQDASISAALIRAQDDIATSLNSPDILNQLCQITAAALGLECSHTLLWDPEQYAFVAVSAYGDTREHAQELGLLHISKDMLDNLTERLKSEDAILCRGDQLRYHELAKMFSYRPSSVIIMPLRREGELIGLHLAGSRTACPALTPRHFRIARGIGHAASMALANACLMEELASASRIKSDFVASMSHELRTPLNHIIGYNDLLIDGAFGTISEEQTDTLQRVRRSSHNLLDLIEATLNLSRLDARKVGIDECDVDLPSLVADLADRLEHSCKKPEVAVEWKVRHHVTTLRTDPIKLQMVLKNLVENAVKFTERGRVVVDICRLDDGVQFEVSDTGAGIPKDLQTAIFEPFRRVHDPAAAPGAGLGLHIVRRLIDLLGGTITVASEVDLGSCFRVWLPFSAAPSGENPGNRSDSRRHEGGSNRALATPLSPTLH